MKHTKNTIPLNRRNFLKTTVLGSAGLIAGPGALWTKQTQAKDGAETLKIGRSEATQTFDPILTGRNGDAWVMDNMNANLVRVKHDGKGVEPDLAESWNMLDGGKRYRFRLREGLKFGNGKPIRPSDVKFSLERARDQRDSVFATMYKSIKEVRTPDAHHVDVVLHEVSAPFLSTIAMFPASILPADVVKSRGKDFASNPVGAGAFKLKKWKRQNQVILVKNEHYWQSDQVNLDKVVWEYIPNDNTRVLNLESGQIDVGITIPFNKVDALSRKSDIDSNIDKSSRENMVLINHSKKPLDDVRVRRALFMGLNRKAIVKAALFGHGEVSNSFIPAGGLFHNPDNKSYHYDPDKAKTLLKQAGVSDLSLKLILTNGHNLSNQVAVMIQSMYKQIGIKVNINKQEGGEKWNSLQKGDFDLSLDYWVNDIFDPDQKASFCLYGYNDNKAYFTRYKNPKMKKLIEEGRRTLDKDKRKNIYYKIQQLAMKDVVYIDLYYAPFLNASRNQVNNFYQNPTGRFMLEKTSIEST
jgi:peptide/nickel transport system substrate-binding protein